MEKEEEKKGAKGPHTKNKREVKIHIRQEMKTKVTVQAGGRGGAHWLGPVDVHPT